MEKTQFNSIQKHKLGIGRDMLNILWNDINLKKAVATVHHRLNLIDVAPIFAINIR